MRVRDEWPNFNVRSIFRRAIQPVRDSFARDFVEPLGLATEEPVG
jgi:hypothetical protein